MRGWMNALACALGLVALAACQAPKESTFTLQLSVDPWTMRLTRADLAGALPIAKLRVGMTHEPVAFDIEDVEVALYAGNGMTPLSRRTVALDPPVRIGPPGSGRPAAAFAPVEVFDEATRGALAAGPAGKYAISFSVKAVLAEARGPFAPVVSPHNLQRFTQLYVEVLPEAPTATPAAPSPSPTALPSPTATPCLVTPGPNDPNGTPAPCTSPPTSPRPSATPTFSQ